MSINDGRLVTTARKLTKDDFDQIATEMGILPGLAKKLGDKPVAAMQIVDVNTPVVTINTQDGTVQAEKMAKPGDAIMTRLNKDGSPKFGNTGELDQWVVDADKLGKLYNKLGQTSPYGDIVGGNNEVLFVPLPKGGEIVAPWGGSQQISEGFLQYSLTTNEVYLNETDGFKTFAVERDVSPIRPEPKIPAEHPKPSNG
jgi:hypothetical protein